jgi:multidrug efflux pump subunit AcrB
VNDKKHTEPGGPIAWMATNRVTANLLMIVLLLGGLFMTFRIKQEVFPEYDLDLVTITVPYPGASPEEVEQGILLVVEEAVRGLEGVKELTATATEGRGRVDVELMADADHQRVYQDIKQQIDRITTFPADAEEPQASLVSQRREVLNLQLHGDVSEWVLREVAEQVRDRLLQSPGISQVDFRGAREYEIQVEISRDNLRAYGLTIEEIARRLRSSSVEIPGGFLETASGDLLLRINDRRDSAADFARMPIITTQAGATLLLEDIATIRDGFADTNRVGSYNGSRSLELAVFRIGDQTPVGVSEAVRLAMTRIEGDLPPGIGWAINNDRSEVYQQRLQLLLKNAAFGLVLVILILGLFLEYRLALRVTMAIPISFFGALFFLPMMGVSINMISMFAFIVALGIVVDSAIVAGENIYEYRQRMGWLEAAIKGARDVAVPIHFSILTNIVAFIPIYFMPGTMGKTWKVIPVVVITVFLISWVVALLVLPAQLGHARNRPAGMLTRFQQRFSSLLALFIEGCYRPSLDFCIRWRWSIIAASLTAFILTYGYVFSGRLGMILMPRIEADRAVVTAVLPLGSPYAQATAVQERLLRAMEEVAAANGGDELIKGVFSLINDNVIEVSAYLTPPGVRPLSTGEVTRRWREHAGPMVGLQSLRYEADRGGPGSGASLTMELSHRDISILEAAGAALAERLAEFPNVRDINDGRALGKQQLDFRVTPAGQSLGLTGSEVARQVRGAFYGAEALRQQRGRNEVRVRVRLPAAERQSELDVEQLMIRTPAGIYVPLIQIAEVERGRSYSSINRRNARRTLTVTADVIPMGETSQVMSVLDSVILPGLALDYPGLTHDYQGRQADMKESIQSLLRGFVLSLVVIYFLLAIPFRSYTQPLIVMVAIPFGMIGAVLGHLLMTYNLSLMSLMGIVALSGVVINGSLVMVNYANQQRQNGDSSLEAIRAAGIRRFRPILLTTLTTFGGLAPMIFETSRQARFLIPMALSLGFGILFSTVILLILVPCLYLAVEDLTGWRPVNGNQAEPGRDAISE